MEGAAWACLPRGLGKSPWRGCWTPTLKEEKGFTRKHGQRRSRHGGLDPQGVQFSGAPLAQIKPCGGQAPRLHLVPLCSSLCDRAGLREGLPDLGSPLLWLPLLLSSPDLALLQSL